MRLRLTCRVVVVAAAAAAVNFDLFMKLFFGTDVDVICCYYKCFVYYIIGDD